MKLAMSVGSQFINKSKNKLLDYQHKWLKRRILGTDILFDNNTAITDVKHRRFSVNIRQLTL